MTIVVLHGADTKAIHQPNARGQLGASRTVHDLDEYRDLAVGTESETMQLGPGRFQASLFRMPLGEMVLSSAAHNTIPLSTSAVGPADSMTFVILMKAPAWGDFNGQPHSIGGFQVLGPSGSIITHNAPGAEVAILQATPQTIRDRAELIGREFRIPERTQSVSVPGTDWAARALRNCVKDALDVAMQPSLRPLAFDPHTFGRLVMEEFSTLAALALEHRSDLGHLTFHRRREIVDMARAYMEANAGRMVSVAELCRVTLTSERALQYAFHDVTGVPPTTYLRLRALHWVRTDLLEGSKDDTTVTEVAMKWGFWHLGRFAAAYRQTFGTTPSQTLRSRTPGTAPRTAHLVAQRARV